MELSFIKGEGPKFSAPIVLESDLDKLLDGDEAASRITYVYETIRLIKEQLAEDKALIGFTGSPWTLATYMIEGQGSKTYNISKKMMYTNPQIFDSWAAAIEPSKYDEFSWKYMIEIVDYLKEKYPHIPIILFPKGVVGFLDKVYGNFDVFGVDWSTPMAMAKEKLGERYVLQGNMEPCRLYSKEATSQCVETLHTIMDGRRHIFNLGHGILPDVAVDHAKHFVNECHRVSAK